MLNMSCSNDISLFFILGFCILLRVLHQGYYKNHPSQQLFNNQEQSDFSKFGQMLSC
jgi:hypothetical protein